MASVQDVFDMAIHLMDAQNESTGATRTTDTNEYALRTPNILTRCWIRSILTVTRIRTCRMGRKPDHLWSV